MDKLRDKVAVITGASSGIGKALAIEGKKAGLRMVLAARNIEAIQAYTSQEQWAKDSFLIVKTDVTQEDACRELVKKAIQKFNQIDILINNAGISMRALFSATTPDVLKKLMDVNFWGTVYCTHYALPWLLKTQGSVVGVSSIAGYRGLPARTGYSASKFAMHGFLEALRTENLHTGLHVLLACPGYTASGIRQKALVADGSAQGESPLNEKGLMQADEVARLIWKAAAKRKRTLVLTPIGKLTVILNKLFPALTDRLVYNHIAKEPDSPFK